MTQKISHLALNSLPTVAPEAGSIIFLSNGSQYVTTTSGTYIKISDLVFTDTLETFGTLNKLYIHTENGKAKLKVWNGIEYVEVGGTEFDATQLESDLAQLQSELATLQGKVTTAESKIVATEGKISSLESKVADLENKEVDLTPIQTQLDDIESNVNTNTTSISTLEASQETHESKSVLDEDGAHNFKVVDDTLFVFENDKWRQVEVIASVLPQAKAFKSVVNADDTITVSWSNPTNTEFLRIQLYVSTQDISGLDIEDMDGMTDVLLVSNGTGESYIHNGTYGVTYYFKLFTIHELFGSEKVATPSVITGKIIDTTPPSVVSNVKIESLNGGLKISWTNPPEQDLGNVRLNYKVGEIIDISDGEMAFNGTGNTVTIENLINDTNYTLRFFTIDNNGNMNDNISMIYSAKPSDILVPFVYGVKIDTTNTNPETSVTYTDDAVGFNSAKMNFDTDSFEYGSWQDKFPFNQIRPCLLKDGVVNYYLDPNDYSKKEDGTIADITSGNDGDVMVKFPKLYWKFERIGTDLYIRYSNYKADEGYKCLAHTRANVDNSDIFLSAYLCSNIDGKSYSLSSKTPVETRSITTFRTIAQDRGYEQMTYYSLLMLQVLFLVMFKNRDSQTTLGKGFTSNVNTKKTQTGGTNQKGLFYGEITGGYQVKFCGIEDFWGNLQYFVDGICCNANREILISNEEFNSNGTNYINYGAGSATDITGFISDVQGGTETGFIIKAKNGSATTYYTDSAQLYANKLASFGGVWNQTSSAGAFRLEINRDDTTATAYYGSRLTFLP